MVSSKKPGKQRKAIYQASHHKRQKLMRAALSEELRGEYKKRTAGLRKGDKVMITRGDFKGHEGTVEKVSLTDSRIHVTGATSKKASGMERFYPIHPSNVMITKFELKDEKRRKILER